MNASRRNVPRPPTSRVDNLSHTRTTNSKPGTDRCTSKISSKPQKQDALSQQKTLGMPPPSRLTKQVKNPIPIRHTLTSKLRMEKANPLLTSFVAGNSEPAVSTTPSRRTTFHPGMLQPKPKLEFRSNIPASEIRPTLKKRGVANERKIIGSVLKENKPPVIGIRNKVNKANLDPGAATSKPSQILAVNKNPASSIPKKDLSSSIKNRRSEIAPNKNVRQSTWNKSIPLSARNGRTTKRVTNTSMETEQMNDIKKKGANSRKLERSSSVVSSVPNCQPKRVNVPAQKQLKSILRKSASVGDLRKASIKNEDINVLSEIDNRIEAKGHNKSLKSVAFYSPLHNSTFTPVKITNTPTPAVLRKRLEDWLAKRGKPSFSYRHLCCFGLPKNASIAPTKDTFKKESSLIEKLSSIRDDQNDAEPRLNETITLEPSDSQLSHAFEKDIENSSPRGSSTPQQETDYCDEDKENAASLSHPEALNDLRKLVHSGYPRDQCEDWLRLISKTHPAVKEIPQYWECIAALEEARGDFSSAVDCYGRAIVKGADADDVDERLDELWEKFCTLSVNSVENKRTPVKKLAIDTKQIFKSTVIKFALQQKAVKRSCKSTDMSMLNVNYIVTPVRRSSRKSTSRFRTTPTTNCVDKLEDLEPSIREQMEFHGNSVLNPGN